MAFPAQSLLGVRAPIPKQHVNKVRKELRKQVCPLPGEGAHEIARRARAVLRAMGFSLTSPRSQEKFPRPAGHRCLPARCQALEMARVKQTCNMQQPAPSSHLPSAIGEKEAAQHSAPSAIGEERLARSCQAAPVMNQSSGQPHCSTAPNVGAMSPLASTGAPWTFHNEQDVGFRAREMLGEGTFGKVAGGVFGPSDQAVAVKLLSRNPLRIDLDSCVDDEIQA